MKKIILSVFVLVSLLGGAISADASVVYDALPNPLPGNVASLGYEATSTSEFGDYVHLGGTDRNLTTVTVTMSNWALQSTPANVAFCSANPTKCTATGFIHPITINIYSNQLDGNGIPTTLLATKTEDVAVPWRPEADPTCPTPTAWRLDASNCFNGLAFNTTFDLSTLNVTLPNDVIVAFAYNTGDYGANPLHVDGPYNSLNVGIPANQVVSVGNDDNVDKTFWDTIYPGYTAGLKEDSGWIPNGTIAMQINAISADSDNDGVNNDLDFCSGTLEDGDWSVNWGNNRWEVRNDSGVLNWYQNKVGKKGVTTPTIGQNISYTYGCNGHQIIEKLNEKFGSVMNGHLKYGLSSGVLEEFHQDLSDGVLDGMYLLETVSVNSKLVAGGSSATTLLTGKNYKFKISGTWTNRPGETVDAKYTTMNNWSTNTDAPAGGYPNELLDVQVEQAFVDWGSYSALHKYELDHTPVSDGVVNFRVFDGNVGTNTPDLGWYGDNNGTLSVNIYAQI
mgnify:CR=1 FL=1